MPLEPRSRYGVLGRDCKCFVIIGTCENGPVTAEPCRVKTNPLPWVEDLTSGDSLSNFFEKTVTDYSTVGMVGEWGW